MRLKNTNILIHNSDVAGIFNQVADLLEIQGANEFRVRAYKNAARTIMGISRNVSDLVKTGEDLSELRGIGRDLAGKIVEIVETGSLRQLKSLERQIPAGLIELMKIPGLGPKRVQRIYKDLGVSSIERLEQAVREGRIQELKGFGRKTGDQILRGIQSAKKIGTGARIMVSVAELIAESLVRYLSQTEGARKLEVAGSYRRRKETVGDLDILMVCDSPAAAMDRFVAYEDVENVIAKGGTRSSVVLRGGFQIDLRVIRSENYGAALHYFTGSKAHNIEIRSMAERRGLKINEYGVFKGEKRIAGRTEEEVYAKVGLPYIEPELREDRGEIETARKGKLPELVNMKDIKGDLHCHSNASDGKSTLEDLADAALRRGHEYLAISDHSKRVTIARGLDEVRLRKQIEQINRLNERLKGIRLLKSIEVDILEDGTLDLPPGVLRELDLVICAIHYNRSLSRYRQTERVLRAMGNPYCHILAHPTGRMIGKREPYEIDMEKLMREAKKGGWYMEINARPERLDLPDTACKMANEMGVKLAISTDAHSTKDFDFLRYGLWQARRGWTEAADVLNTHRWKELKRLLRRA
jgi:DNA polymerase (family 10)